MRLYHFLEESARPLHDVLLANGQQLILLEVEIGAPVRCILCLVPCLVYLFAEELLSARLGPIVPNRAVVQDVLVAQSLNVETRV